MEKLPFNHGLIDFKNALHSADAGRAARLADLADAEILAKKAAAPSIKKEAVWFAKSFSRIAFLLVQIAARLTVKVWRAFTGADDVLPDGCKKLMPSLPIWANQFLGTWYDARACRIAAPRGWNEPEKPPIMPHGLDLHTLRDGKTIVARTFDFDDDGHQIPAWNVLKSTAKADQLLRNAALTDADLAELGRVNGLTADRAATLKPLWAKGLSNKQIEALDVGYKLRMIETYTACFSRALSRKR